MNGLEISLKKATASRHSVALVLGPTILTLGPQIRQSAGISHLSFRTDCIVRVFVASLRLSGRRLFASPQRRWWSGKQVSGSYPTPIFSWCTPIPDFCGRHLEAPELLAVILAGRYQIHKYNSIKSKCYGGEEGIRTLETAFDRLLP